MSRKQTSHISDVGLGSRAVCTREYNDSITVKGESFYFICLLVLLSFLWTDRSDWGGDVGGVLRRRKQKKATIIRFWRTRKCPPEGVVITNSFLCFYFYTFAYTG